MYKNACIFMFSIWWNKLLSNWIHIAGFCNVAFSLFEAKNKKKLYEKRDEVKLKSV